MSYNVRFWDIRERLDRRKPYMVRWTVNGREKSESFMTLGLADSRRSKLVTAARDGEPFDEHTGLPASELRAIKQRTTWYDLAHEYLDQRWDRSPGNTRRTLADAFATITPALVYPGAAYPEPRVLRRALYSWAFNKNAWAQEPNEEWRKALDWMKRNSLPVSALAEADVLRRALDAMCRKLDGEPAAAKTARRKRAAFSEVLNTAVEKGYFAENPLNGLRWNAPAVNEEVDPAAVPNPAQVARLLAAVAQQRGRGPHLEAFYGCIYYAAMRPGRSSTSASTSVTCPTQDGGCSTCPAASSPRARNGRTTAPCTRCTHSSAARLPQHGPYPSRRSSCACSERTSNGSAWRRTAGCSGTRKATTWTPRPTA
ncbi:site-specific integrase [Streptomyces melanogenes]|uniref:site-specific integrase n=1 Tax=Streptomyces melanogenes TaxID=67326 RepID=UPI0037B237B8